MEAAAIGAARWVVGKALSPVTDGLLESWTASSKLGPNVRELTMELLYAQGMLNNARGRELHNRALEHLLLQLRNVAYDADDVLDELEYFRIQDELDGTYETTDAQDRGLVGGIVLNARHTARAVRKCLLGSGCSCCGRKTPDDDDDDDQQEAGRGCMDAVTKCLSGTCSCCGGRTHDDDDGVATASSDDDDDDDQQEVREGCMAKVISSACNTAKAVGKHIPCPCLPRSRCSNAQQRERVVPAPKLKFDRVKISQRMKDIVDQLKPLCAKVATILDLELSGFNHTMAHTIAADRQKTTPEIIEFKLYGRDNLKNNLVDDITHGKYCADSLTVVSIVGPGGIGKTTFTQHIYQKVSNHFQVSVWICVSQNFNANRLAQEIVKKIPNNDNEKYNASDEELIQIRLQSKKFLLVLDDMWTYHEDEWKKLLAPFKKVGTTGNVVIVTTRIPKVAKMVATTVDCLVRLERLEDKDCMLFFQACVFGDQQSWGKHANLHSIGDEIVKKLKGFPLAVKTIGRLLRNKLTLDHWIRVLESKEWEFRSGDDDIMPALKLSYDYLSFDLQQCFSHCALFPEDYEFDREELIRLWIGFGLLDNCDKNNRMEDVGSDYLDALIDQGFFQKSENEEARYVIHDLLHELAMSVSANECLSIRGSNVRSIQVPTSIRHLSISIDDTHVKDRKTFENFKTDLSILGKKLKVENLRTLMLFGQYHGSFSKTFRKLFRKAKSLRVILLSWASYDVEDLFHNFSQLIHLRYLRLIKLTSDNDISLPNSIPKCYHLMVLHMEICYDPGYFGKGSRYLDIERCYDLGFLGREMKNLVKLRYFVHPDDSSVFEVGKLKSLQELSQFTVKKRKNGFELEQLGQLQQLQGSLKIDGLERVEDVKEADEAKLVHMNHLHGLRLHWDDRKYIKDVKQEEDILESLKPHSYLREISIEEHRGTSCPSWLGEDISISNLESLRLVGVAWKKFPPLGQWCTTNEHGEECISYIKGQSFLNLKKIILYRLPRLKRWHGNDNSESFSCLEELKVGSCNDLLELPFSYCSCSQAEQMFPKLQKIVISHCPNLLSLPPIPWSIDLRIAEIIRVGTVGIKELIYTKDEDLRITMYDVDHDSELSNMLSFHNLRQTEELRISRCPPMPLQHMQMLASLKSLSISYCPSVLWPVEGDTSAQCQIPVEYLFIFNCDVSGKELTQLMSCFPNLQILSIDGCKMITELGVAEKQTTSKHAQLSASACETEDAHVGQQRQQIREEIEAVDEGKGLLLVPREMIRLEILDCRNLRLCPGTLVDSKEAREEGLQGLRSLTSLDITSCPEFFASSASSAHSLFPASLQSLDISGCTNLTSLVMSGFPEFLNSAYCPFPASLQSLCIKDCTDLTGEGFLELFPQGQGCLTRLSVYGSPKFFTCTDTEPSRPLNQQDLPHHSRSCELETDDIAGVLAQPICARLSSFLTKLVLDGNHDIECFTKEQEAALQILTSLQELEIRSCSSLRSVPEGLSGLPKLRRFEIEYLRSVHSIPKDGLPNSLTELRISNCDIGSLPKATLPNSLQNLEITSCEEIQSIPKGSFPSSLQNLKIISCPGIRSLPKGTLPSSLQSLRIEDCSGIRSIPKGSLPGSLQNLKILDCSGIQSLDGLPDSLRLLDVSGSNEELTRQCRKLRGIIPIVIEQY